MTGADLLGGQRILEEHFDENYEPTDAEIRGYAKDLGIDPDSEPELLWLPREAYNARLPLNWVPIKRLQRLIDSNKRWLETRTKDPSIPLFRRDQVPPIKRSLIPRIYNY